jgi:hypothetical protein
MIDTSSTGQRVLVCCAEFHSYHKIIAAGFERLGHVCELFDERDSPDAVSKALTRLKLRQLSPRAMRAFRKKLARRTRDFRPDVILIIAPEMIDPLAIAALRVAAPGVRIILYMWESLVRKPLGRPLLGLVDQAFSYDTVDCEAVDGIDFLPLFHTLDNMPVAPEPRPGGDMVFIGSVQFARLIALAAISRTLARKGQGSFFFLYAPTLLHWLIFKAAARLFGYRGQVARHQISHREYLSRHDEAACIIDIQRGNQTGLALRSFDAIFAGKPLLTTNLLTPRYDFYDKAPVGLFAPGDDLKVPDVNEAAWPDAELHERYKLSTWIKVLMGSRSAAPYLERAQSGTSVPQSAEHARS